MFDGIDKIEWDRIPTKSKNPEYSPERIPELIRELLNEDAEIRQHALSIAFRIIVYDDSISHFTEAAPPAMPFLMEFFAAENFNHHKQFVQELSGGMMLMEEFGHELRNVSEPLQEIYWSVLSTIRPYLPKFFPLLQHENERVRNATFSILSCFPEESNILIPVMLDSLAMRIQQFSGRRDWWLWHSIHIVFEHGSPTGEQIKQYFHLTIQAFQISLKIDTDDLYTSDMLRWIKYDLAKMYPQYVTNAIVTDLTNQFEQTKSVT